MGVPDDMDCIAFARAEDGLRFSRTPSRQRTSPSRTSRRVVPMTTFIIYTSGSTGTPKGVLLLTISHPTRELVAMLDITPEDRGLSCLPLAHGMDRWLECLSLYAGSHVFFAQSLDTFAADLRVRQWSSFQPRLWLKFQLGVFKKMPPNKSICSPRSRSFGIVKKKILAGLGLDSCRFAGSGSAPIPPNHRLVPRSRS